jgi:hypothetical protein
MPAIVPSHVFLGEMGEMGVRPINEPTIYAIVSFTQTVTITKIGTINSMFGKNMAIAEFKNIPRMA